MRAVFIVEKNKDSFVSPYTQNYYKRADVCIGVIDEENGVACGFLAAIILPGKKIRIIYINVHENYRRRGAGSCMIDLLEQLAHTSGAEKLEFVSDETSEADGLISLFLTGIGFVPAKKVICFSVPIRDFRDADEVSFDGHIETVKSLSGRSWNRYAKLMNMVFPWRSSLDGELSYVISDGNYNPVGVIFASRTDDGLKLIRFKVKGDNIPAVAQALYGFAINRAKRRLFDEDLIIVEVGDMKRAKMLFGLAEVKPLPDRTMEYLTRPVCDKGE